LCERTVSLTFAYIYEWLHAVT